MLSSHVTSKVFSRDISTLYDIGCGRSTLLFRHAACARARLAVRSTVCRTVLCTRGGANAARIPACCHAAGARVFC